METALGVLRVKASRIALAERKNKNSEVEELGYRRTRCHRPR